MSSLKEKFHPHFHVHISSGSSKLIFNEETKKRKDNKTTKWKFLYLSHGTRVSIHCHGKHWRCVRWEDEWEVFEVCIVAATGVKTIIIGIYVFYEEGGDYMSVGLKGDYCSMGLSSKHVRARACLNRQFKFKAFTSSFENAFYERFSFVLASTLFSEYILALTPRAQSKLIASILHLHLSVHCRGFCFTRARERVRLMVTSKSTVTLNVIIEWVFHKLTPK